MFSCVWPDNEAPLSGQRGEGSAPVLRVLVLSDTHLLGAINGHWFDKLRREWQMERAFQTALWLLQPEIVFILGDIFDEGKWSSPEVSAVMYVSVALATFKQTDVACQVTKHL
ncbi:MPPE1 Metallophosphoesterase, partial [Polypterus senegalus]|nr:MPPE1 Metallophosphoesterase [Polypterus senegalus]